MVSAYAPVGAALKEERGEFARDLQLCFHSCGRDEILIVGADMNAAAGIRREDNDNFAPGRDKVRGRFGEKYENEAGRELCTLLAAKDLYLATTYFQHKN